MVKTIAQSGNKFNEFLSKLKQDLLESVTRQIEKQLEVDVEKWLYRDMHTRRKGIKRHSQAHCQRCGSRATQQFMRNGHRKRELVTTYGMIQFWLPCVVCECGGSVQIPFSIIQPYQRLWDDMLLQIGRWADLGLSLRQMQSEIGEAVRTQVGLRKLNTVVHDVAIPTAIELTSVPPIVMLDAIWVTLLASAGQVQADQHQRQRLVKIRQKVCVLVALGLYPQTGRWGVLGWQLAPTESQSAWEALLLPLEQRGVYRQRGLELLIHDGGKELVAALKLLYHTNGVVFINFIISGRASKYHTDCHVNNVLSLNSISCNLFKRFSTPPMKPKHATGAMLFVFNIKLLNPTLWLSYSVTGTIRLPFSVF